MKDTWNSWTLGWPNYKAALEIRFSNIWYLGLPVWINSSSISIPHDSIHDSPSWERKFTLIWTIHLCLECRRAMSEVDSGSNGILCLPKHECTEMEIWRLFDQHGVRITYTHTHAHLYVWLYLKIPPPSINYFLNITKWLSTKYVSNMYNVEPSHFTEF